MTFFTIFEILARDIKISDNEKKKIIIYLIDTMNKPSTLYEVKKYLDDVVTYEKS